MKGRLWRLLLCGWWLPVASPAATSVSLHIGQARHPNFHLENLSASLAPSGAWQAAATLTQTDLKQLSAQAPVTFGAGNLRGTLQAAGKNAQLQQLQAALNLDQADFSNPSGTQAAQKLGGALKLRANQDNGLWQWQATLDWREGELFWQPLYFAQGGQHLEASGSWGENKLVIQQALLQIAGVGDLRLNGEIQPANHQITRLEVAADQWPLAQAYPLLIKPFMLNSAWDALEMTGKLDFKASLHQQRINTFQLGLHNVNMADRNNRFAFYQLNADIPWSYDARTQATIGYQSGQLLGLRLGAARHELALERYSLAAPHLELPILDGNLLLNDAAAAYVNDQWYWRVQADLAGVSMPEFSAALGWPDMQGKIEARIPMLLYQAGYLTTDGPLQLKVFDGDIRVDHLTLDQPLGRAPRLNADITMRNLDLAALTKTFSFGDISGHLDGDVTGLQLSGKQPVQFDARFYSSPGRYPRKISQRALQNISALGGAGAAAAIQRSFLRFLESFNYQQIGLSCKLRKGVCAMGGVEDAASGYVMVKGSGIPSITVLGYNRNVGWKELLGRVEAVTQGDSKPLIK